jgi:hypothetical protein
VRLEFRGVAHAPDVLREAVEEADLLAHTQAPLEQVGQVTRLAHDALLAGDGEIPDEECKVLPPSRWHRLGVQ